MSNTANGNFLQKPVLTKKACLTQTDIRQVSNPALPTNPALDKFSTRRLHQLRVKSQISCTAFAASHPNNGWVRREFLDTILWIERAAIFNRLAKFTFFYTQACDLGRRHMTSSCRRRTHWRCGSGSSWRRGRPRTRCSIGQYLQCPCSDRSTSGKTRHLFSHKFASFS